MNRWKHNKIPLLFKEKHLLHAPQIEELNAEWLSKIILCMKRGTEAIDYTMAMYDDMATKYLSKYLVTKSHHECNLHSDASEKKSSV